MAGRPALRIGAHGKIVREYLGGGVWLARTRFRDSDGVTRRIQRLGPPDEFDKHGKLAEDALIEALVERRPPMEVDALGPETLVGHLVRQHLDRLAEDGRSPATLATYDFAAAKLEKFIGGLRVREASTACLDAALRSMRTAHGATMAKQAKTILRGALQLAVMASVLNANPVRDVQPLQTRRQPKGASALSADELRVLLLELKASSFCHAHDLVDPVTLLVATGLRRSELLALRWKDFDADAGTLTVAGKLVRAKGQGLAPHGRNQDSCRQADVAATVIRRKHVDGTPHGELLRRTADDLSVNGWHLARPQQLRQGVAHGARGIGFSRGHSFRKTVPP
jgi:integrase